MIRRRNATLSRFVLLLATALLTGATVLAASAQAASPAWRVLGVTGPTNLPPVASEIQKVAVDATGGTFSLEFQSQTTGPLAFDASPGEIAAALNGLSTIGGAGGEVEVSGGPGGLGGTIPYFVRFGGALASTDVAQIGGDSSQLSGGARTATVSTQDQGGAPGTGSIMIYVTNVGGAPSSGTVTLNIGPLPPGITTSDTPSGADWSCGPVGAGQSSLTCSRTTPIRAGRTGQTVEVPVSIGPLAAAHSLLPLAVEGGGVLPDPSGANAYVVPVTVSSQPASAGVQAFWAGAFDADGRPATQAGGHPFSAGTGFLLRTVLSPSGQVIPAGDLKAAEVDLPPGFIGNPQVTGRCPQYQLVGDPGGKAPICPEETVVGRAQPSVELFTGGSAFETSGESAGGRVYNDEPPFGSAAEFSFPFAFAQQSIVGSLRSDEDYGVTVTAPNVPLYYWVYGSFVTLEGSPAGALGKAFLANPTDCAEQARTTPVTTLRTNTWQQASSLSQARVENPPVIGCDQLRFEPSFSFRPSTSQAASPTGATAHLTVPQDGLLDPAKLASPHLKRSVVTLPQGLNLNPSAANGLEACTTQQIGLKGTNFAAPNRIRFDESQVSCPDASKIGTAEILTPLLDQPLPGTIYLAAQDDNPFHSLLAMYIVVDDDRTGVVAKLPGEVRPDLQTGQLTAVFDDNPQVPFSELNLSFRGGGPRSTLATPDVCSSYSTVGEWTPWSAPESGPPAKTSDSFTTSGGPGDGSCPTSKAARPFDPERTAGTTGTQAGGYCPLVIRVDRKDGEQELKRLEINLPPGLTGKLAGIATCSQAAIDSAKGKTGKAEQASSSCPAASQIGLVRTTAGVGGSPIEVGGKAYLAGPYEKAPLSVVVMTPAVAGPFDLGNVVIRTPLFVDPKTAQLRAVSDEVPHILEGIPLLLRSVEIKMDRNDFTLNPTNCSKMQVEIALTGAGGDPQSSGDDVVSRRSVPFQVGNCRALAFRPNLKIQLKGGTKRAKYQRLTATVTYPEGAGYANIARAAVTLPHSLFLAQEHIRTVCTRVQFAAHACPQGSIYGRATAITPLLDEPLTGPVYLRSSNNPLPDLVAALRGPDSMPIEVELAGRTDSVHSSLRNTFDLVPDAPVSKFTLQLFGGKKSLVVTSRNLCKGKKQRATGDFTAQNGLTRRLRPVVQNDCKRRVTKKAKGKKHRSDRGR